MKYNYIHWILFLIITSGLSACSKSSVNKFSLLVLNNLNNDQVSLEFSENQRLKVFIFMSPECPFCINYTKTINEFNQNKKYDEIVFYAVYPGTYYSAEEIGNFHDEYNFDINVLLDPELKLTRLFEATVTPQAIIVDKSKFIVYSGAIDNWAFDTGIKRQVISEHYMRDALDSLINGIDPSKSTTKPVGCFIEL